MNEILPNSSNYKVGDIVIGYDGQWYILSQRHNWSLMKNSPGRDKIIAKIRKLKNRSIGNLIELLAFYVNPKDGQIYIVNAWGSVQYASAYAFYLILRILDYYEIDPIKYLNISINLGPKKSLENIKNQIMKNEIKYIFEDYYCDPTICYEINDSITKCQSYSTITDKDLKEAKTHIDVQSLMKTEKEKFIADLYELIDTDFYKIDDFFYYAKEGSWDLWSWVPFVFNSLYPNSHIINISKSPGFGPELNQIVQSENYLVGLQAYLLFKEGWIEDDSIFANFDT